VQLGAKDAHACRSQQRGGGAGLVAAGLASGISLGLAGTAQAAGGCPTREDWTLAGSGIVIDNLDNGNFADQNGDSLACFKVNDGQTKRHNGVASFTWKDNTSRASPHARRRASAGRVGSGAPRPRVCLIG
jgi:hypothetical protein